MSETERDHLVSDACLPVNGLHVLKIAGYVVGWVLGGGVVGGVVQLCT